MYEHLKDYLDTMAQDAHMQYIDEHADSELPDSIPFDDRARQDAEAVVKAFYEAFPDTKTEGGEVYLERVYGDEVKMPKDERAWIAEKYATDATASIDESVDGGFHIFFE